MLIRFIEARGRRRRVCGLINPVPMYEFLYIGAARKSRATFSFLSKIPEPDPRYSNPNIRS